MSHGDGDGDGNNDVQYLEDILLNTGGNALNIFTSVDELFTRLKLHSWSTFSFGVMANCRHHLVPNLINWHNLFFC